MDIEGIFLRWFLDYANPTETELCNWMEDPEAVEVMEDSDLIVGSSRNLHALVRLASNNGPQREYIVHCLYVATAEAFNWCRDTIGEAINLVPEDTHEDVLEWRSNAEYLLTNPKTYREYEWLGYCFNKNKRRQ